MNACSPSWGKPCVEKHAKFGRRRLENKRKHCAMDSPWTLMVSTVIRWPYASNEFSSTTLGVVNPVTSIFNTSIFLLKAVLRVAIFLYVWISDVVLIQISAWKYGS